MSDHRTVHAVIGLLGLLGVLLTCGLLAVVITGRDVPEAVLTLLGTQLGAVVGALGALLAHTGSGPAEGSASGTAADPVHVDVDGA
jgi:hypothetical protein